SGTTRTNARSGNNVLVTRTNSLTHWSMPPVRVSTSRSVASSRPSMGASMSFMGNCGLSRVSGGVARLHQQHVEKRNNHPQFYRPGDEAAEQVPETTPYGSVNIVEQHPPRSYLMRALI